MNKLLLTLSAILILFIVSCSPKVDIEAEKLQVKTVIENHLLANESENIESYLDSWADNAEMINLGSGGEYWVGRKDLEEHAVQTWEIFEDSEFDLRDLVINVDEYGRVAWFTCYFDIKATLFGEIVTINGVRFSGVLKKQDGKWAYVQTHASVPSPSE